MLTTFAKDPRPTDLHLETSVKMRLAFFLMLLRYLLALSLRTWEQKKLMMSAFSALLAMHIEQTIKVFPKLTCHIPEKWYPWMVCLEDQSSNLTDGQHFYQETKAFLIAPQRRCIQCSKCQWLAYTAIRITSEYKNSHL
jgi:hypothetical protein